MARPSLLLAGLLLLALPGAGLAGCGILGGPAPGAVSGMVLYDGRPAAGKRVSLLGGEGAMKAVTDAQGRFAFSGLSARSYQVSYAGTGDRADALPNEVAQWVSVPFDGAKGTELPAFDVSYAGLLYPDVGMSLIVNATTPVPFHWSTQRSAQRYRLKLTNDKEFSFTGEWSADPMAVFQADVPTGSFYWTVEIDGGERGGGVTPRRRVDLGPNP